MNGNDLATLLADGMKDAGTFDIPQVGGGKIYSQIAYDSTLVNLKLVYNIMVSYLKSNMDVVNVTTNVSTTVAAGIPVATVGTAVAQSGTTTSPGAGTGTGTQSNIGNVL